MIATLMIMITLAAHLGLADNGSVEIVSALDMGPAGHRGAGSFR